MTTTYESLAAYCRKRAAAYAAEGNHTASAKMAHAAAEYIRLGAIHAGLIGKRANGFFEV